MKKAQKIIIAIGAFLLFGMGVYPPWVFVVAETVYEPNVLEPVYYTENAGYSLIMSPPEYKRGLSA